jgi:hypothetical protein
MHILAAIKREEKKLEKQLRRLPHQLDGVRGAAKALGHSVEITFCRLLVERRFQRQRRGVRRRSERKRGK